MVADCSNVAKVFFCVLSLYFVGRKGASEGRIDMDYSKLKLRVTTCGSSGRRGPSFHTCKNYYSSNNSLLDDLLVSPTVLYNGTQFIKLPRNGSYQITIAGAGGGKGLCNPQPGAAPILRRNILTSDRDIVGIIVGQRGTDACHTIPSNRYGGLCLINVTADNCTSVYQMNSGLCSLYDGGGGGGGASLFHRLSEYPSTSNPGWVVIAPGGGGAGVQSNSLQSGNEINGRPNKSPQSTEVKCISDGSFSNTCAGSGSSGSDTVTIDLLGVDGLNFNSRYGPLGGRDCIESIGALMQATCSGGTEGGFGGGGGGCAAGGGGGGQPGGSSFGHNDRSGEGGYAFSSSNLEYLGLNSGDGYIILEHENCGCVGECIKNETAETFHCSCPNGSVLASDGFDCHKREMFDLLPQRELFSTINMDCFGHMELEPYSVSFETKPTFVRQLWSTTLEANLQHISKKVTSNCTLLMPTERFHDRGICGLLILNRIKEIVANILILGNEVDTVIINNISQVKNIDSSIESYEFNISPSLEMLRTSVEFSSVVYYHTKGLNCTFINILGNFSLEILPAKSQSEHLSDETIKTFFAVLAKMLIDVLPTPSTEIPVPPTPPLPLLIVVLMSVLGGILVLACIILVFLVAVVIAKSNKKHSPIIMDNPDYTLTNEERELIERIKEQPVEIRPRRPTRKMSFRRRSRSVSMSTNMRDEIHPLPIVNAYAELNIPDLGIDINIPKDSDQQFQHYNKYRQISDEKEWYFSREKLTYLRELGEGEFGKVLLMTAKGICGLDESVPVAVKTLSRERMKDIDKFMEEVDLMKQFTHPNIVSLLGYCPAEKDGAPMMILELMSYGDLQSFLLSNRPQPDVPAIISDIEFFHFALDIARALEFLTSREYVHRDVAARNCLVGKELVLKLADFGLARDIHGRDHYRMDGTAKLPVKWMAPESLLFGQFTPATDVWSFGVLLWEITSYGYQPLEDKSVQDVVHLASTGELRHEKPERCPDELYDLIMQCTSTVSNIRPQFKDIRCTLQEYYNDELRLQEDCHFGNGNLEDSYSKRSPSPIPEDGIDPS